MKHLLNGTAITVALMFAVPALAQAPSTQYPAGAPSTSQPGAYTQQQAPAYGQQPSPSAQQPMPSTSQAMPSGQQPTPSAPYAQQRGMPGPSATTPDTTAENATEPMPTRRGVRRHARHYAGHARRMHQARYGEVRGRAPSDNVANQLNRAELNQSGSGMPPTGYAPRRAPQGYPQQPYPQQGAQPRY